MFDIRDIRNDPSAFDEGLRRRGLDPLSAAVLALDEQRRALQTDMQEARSRRNDLSRRIGAGIGKGGDADALKAEVASLRDGIRAREERERALGEEIKTILEALPNRPADDVPEGPDETANVEARRWGEPRSFEFAPRQHFEIGEALGLMDFDRAATLSGARFVVLRGALARLERALGQYMLDTHTAEFGYQETSPPALVRDEILYGTGQLPKFGDDLFKTTHGLWLIPTAEVPLTNMVHDTVLEEVDLPLRFAAHTECFRSEAGAAGRDTRGMLRQHQFKKVELVSVTHPDKSYEELDRMTSAAETILRRLHLPYRVMVLSTGDMGFGASKTLDIEVWLPGQNAYREISSCSNCEAFQARRMRARFRPAGERKGTVPVHTLNGSGVAIGRCLIAVLENGQQADGSVVIPDALRPYMGGLDRIGA